MSFSGSISNALSGMRMSVLSAELISSNLANSTTEGYAARSLKTSSRVIGGTGGVKIDGISRAVNKALVADWQKANADLSNLTTKSQFVSRVEKLFSTPDDPTSLSAMMANFESSLISAASRPDLNHRLDGVSETASQVVEKLNSMSASFQSMRSEVDAAIATTVSDLNDRLSQIAGLNSQIGARSVAGSDTASLKDLRQTALDEISAIVPIRVLERDQETVAIVASSGTILLDGTAVEFDFARTPTVTEHMSLSGGQLSGLELFGQPIPTNRMEGGSLGALLAVRDEIIPGYQVELDAFAANLIERVQTASVDPTLGVGDAGFFTDSGAAYDSINQTGISRRIAINPVADSENGGDIWRIRDGIMAATPGPVGNSNILNAMLDSMSSAATVPFGLFTGQAETTQGHVSKLMSLAGTDRSQLEARQSFAAAQSDGFQHERLFSGVDTDSELQKLMEIEKAYAANAQVLRTVDEMLDVLMGI